jgi:hypothetical protein
MKDPILNGHWYRYIGAESIELENNTSKLYLKGRAVFCVVENKGVYYITPPPQDTMDVKVGLSEAQPFYPVDRGVLSLILKTSKAYKGNIGGKSVQPGTPDLLTQPPPNVEDVDDDEDLIEENGDNTKPKIPGSVSIELEPLTEIRKTSFGPVIPPSGKVYDLIVAGFGYVGLRKTFKRPVAVGVSSTIGCSIMRSFNPVRGYKENTIIINVNQMRQLFGVVNAKTIGQVFTHELGHYLINNKVIKQTELMRFKKAVAARSLHPDQFNHPGYSYPWWEEAWAMLCEAMVHGHSVRGFQDPTGWKIAERYFVNRFLKGGNYTGRTEPSG